MPLGNRENPGELNGLLYKDRQWAGKPSDPDTDFNLAIKETRNERVHPLIKLKKQQRPKLIFQPVTYSAPCSIIF